MPDVNLDLARPFYLIKILDKDSNDLKYVWSANIFLDDERPEDDSKIAPNSYIEDIEVKSNFEPPINIGEVKINHNVGSTPNIAINDVLKVYLGYYSIDNSQNPVYSLTYTGQIDKIKASLNHTIIRGSSEIKKITDHKRNLIFSRTMTIKEIIQKLAINDGDLELAPNGISDTTISKQKGYGISKNISIYKHVKKLTDMVDFDIYMDVFDKFNARLWQPEDVPPSTNSSGQTKAVNWLSSRNESENDVEKQLIHTVYFGVNTIDLELDVKSRTQTSMEIITLADSEGEEVFTIEPPVGTSGGSGGNSGGESSSTETSSSSTEGSEKQVFPRITKEDADRIAEVIVRRSSGGLNGKITVIGSPQIRLGDGLKIQGQVYGKKPFRNLISTSTEFDASFTSDSETEEGGGESSSSGSSQPSEETLFKITGLKHLYNDNLGFITKLNINESEIAQPEPEEEEGGEEEEEQPEEGEEEEEEPEEGEEEGEEPEESEEEGEGEEEEPVKKMQVIEIEDALFHHDSAVLLPEQPEGPSSEDGAEPSKDTQRFTGIEIISAIYNFIDENPDKQIIIAGHTDTTGRVKYNFELSSLRANSILYILIGNKPLWVNNSDKKHKVEDYQQILKHYSTIWGWDCDPGVIDDRQGPKTREATRNFQDRYNKDFRQNISVDGIVGKQTWGAIYDCYNRELNKMLDTTKESLAEKRAKVKFVSDDFKILACGESHPIEESKRDNYRSQINRRVEVLFFDPDEAPKLTCPNPAGPYNDEVCDLSGCPIYKEGEFELEYITPEVPPVEPPEELFEIDLKLLTQNTMLLPEGVEFLGSAEYVDERVPAIIELLRDYDIIGLQEIFKEDSQNSIVRGWYNDILHQNPEWINLNEDILKQERSPEEMADRGVFDARPNDKDGLMVCDKYFLMGPDEDDLDQDGGLVIFSKYPIIRSSAFVFSSTSGIFSADYYANKGVLYACIDVCPDEPEKDFHIHVFNTHTQAGGDNSDIRAEQLEEFKEFIKNCTREDGAPIILLGDFNVPGETDEYIRMMRNFRELHLNDIWKTLKPTHPGHTWIGEDQTTNSNSPYGDLGNVLAVDDGSPERLDYFLNYSGDRLITTELNSIDTVPAEGPKDELYCFDNEVTCNTIGRNDACDGLKSYTVSDHLGLELEIHVKEIK